MKIILGSSSPFRRAVMDATGIEYETMSADIDERGIRAHSPHETPIILSFAKSQALINEVTEPAFLITCDQVVVCDGEVHEKPLSEEEVRGFYKKYRDHEVEFVNGITVVNTETGKTLSATEISRGDLKNYSEDFLEEVIEEGVIYKCAGGIGDRMLEAHLDILEGAEDSIKGLPVDFIMEMIEKVK